MRLKDHVIVVSGGSGLLGKAIILELKKEGATAVNFELSGQTDLGRHFVQCDITNTESVNDALFLVEQEWGKIDGLVNNAYPRTKDWGTDFEEIPYSSWQQNVDMQLNSYFYMSQQVLKTMKTRRSGSIVNMTSIYGVVGNDFGVYEGTNIVPPAAYSAIKGGLINFTRYLAAKYGPYGVRANCVSPGGIFDHQPAAFVEAYEKKVPMKRMGTPEDIAPVVAFLLSAASRYITGQNILVDGGWTCI